MPEDAQPSQLGVVVTELFALVESELGASGRQCQRLELVECGDPVRREDIPVGHEERSVAQKVSYLRLHGQDGLGKLGESVGLEVKLAHFAQEVLSLSPPAKGIAECGGDLLAGVDIVLHAIDKHV